MTRLVVFGNCQGGPIGRLIERATPAFEVVRAPPVHKVPESGIAEVEAMVASADLVLTQPIESTWGRLSTASLRQVFRGSQWVEYPSIYFSGLFPYLQYVRLDDGQAMQGPLGDYHDRRILRSYLAGRSQSACLAQIQERDVDGCRAHYQAALEESRRRESDLPIRVMDNVERRIADARLFHTFNHPTNHVMWDVVTQFLKLVSVPMAVDTPPITQFLDNVTAAIPLEMSEAIGLRFTDDRYHSKRAPVAWEDLVAGYYETYAARPDLEAIANSERNIGR